MIKLRIKQLKSEEKDRYINNKYFLIVCYINNFLNKKWVLKASFMRCIKQMHNYLSRQLAVIVYEQ